MIVSRPRQMSYLDQHFTVYTRADRELDTAKGAPRQAFTQHGASGDKRRIVPFKATLGKP